MKLIIFLLISQTLLFVLARKKTVKRTKVKIDANVKDKVEAYGGNYKEIQKETDEEIKEDNIRKLVEEIEQGLKLNQNSTKESLKEVIDYFSQKITDEANGYHRLIRIINHAKRLLLEQNITIDNEDVFKAAKNLSEEENFSATKDEDFYQPPFKGACRLYSTLFALTKNKILLTELNNLVRKSSTAYIIEFNKKYYSVPIKDIETTKSKNSKLETNPSTLAVDELSPSSNSLVIAFGMALQKASRDDPIFPDYIDEDVAYNLVNYDLIDAIFGKQAIAGGELDKDTTNFENIFKSDGTVTIKDKNYSGDFIVSFVTYIKEGKGHATSAYFNKSDNKWMFFDNFLKPHLLEINSSNMKNSKYFKLHSFILIGNPQIKNRKKLKKNVIK